MNIFTNWKQSDIATHNERVRRGGASKKYENNPDREVSNTVAKRDQTPALDGTAQGEIPSVGRVRVRFVGYRVRPLDPDNFAGSCKDCIDFLRHAQLIIGDESWRITLETEQVRVSSFAQERTEIEIDCALFGIRLVRPLPNNGVADCPKCKANQSVKQHNGTWSCWRCGYTEIVDDDSEAQRSKGVGYVSQKPAGFMKFSNRVEPQQQQKYVKPKTP